MLLRRYAKNIGDNDWTQLQFTCTAVPISDNFPLSVKTVYRKYTQEEVLLIQQSNVDGMLGFKTVRGIVKNQPEAVPPNLPEGMFLLRGVPPRGTALQPAPFVEGSRQKLERVVEEIAKQYSTHLPEVLAEWIHFRDHLAPQNDNANDFLATKGMYIPLYNELFGLQDEGAGGENAQHVAYGALEREEVAFTPCVQWSGRGRGREVIANAPTAPVVGGAVVAATTVQRPRKPHGQTAPATAAPATAAPAAAAPASAPANRRGRRPRSPSPDVSDESCEEEEPDVDYEYLPVSSNDGPAVSSYCKYIGRRFFDNEEEKTYEVVGVCEMVKRLRRNSSNKVYVFKYVDVDDRDEFEYTVAQVMLNSYWCIWETAPAAVGRSERAMRRNENQRPS